MPAVSSPSRARLLGIARRYGFAALCAGVATLVLMPVRPHLPGGFSPPLLLAIAASALAGGVGPGLFAVLLTTLIANAWFYSPFGQPSMESAEDLVRQSIFVASAIPLALLGGAVRRTRARADAEHEALRQSEERYRTSETRLRRVLQSDMIGIAFWDGSKVSEANDAFLRLLGYDRVDLAAGLIRHERLTPPEHQAADQRAIAEVGRRGACTPYEKEFFRKDGSRVPVLVGGARLAGDREDGVFFVLDLTERQRAAEHLQAAQRLETIGRLAGGIAHETNNQMSVVLGAAHFILDRDDLPAPVRGDIAQILKAAEHTAAITRQLLAFSRRQVLQPQPLDLNGEIQNLEPVLRRTLGVQITLALRLAPELRPVRVDPGQLSQVLLNLILNARDAMPTGGKVTIATVSTTLEHDGSAPAEDEAVLPGSYAVLSVQDTGHGMDHETRSHIFEPFFTTKPVGRGTGLGLSTVHGIVRQSNGYVRVESAPGCGATFTVYLPHTEAHALPPLAVVAPPPAPQRRGTILVVDDEPEVRRMIVRALRKEGYSVLEAATGDEALAVVSGERSPLDLLVTDLHMPGIDGGELATQLEHGHPKLRVLFTSGHADEVVQQHGLLAERPGRSFLQKPYSPSTLAARVRQILDAAPY